MPASVFFRFLSFLAANEPVKSARGLAHSKTCGRALASVKRYAFWSAVPPRRDRFGLNVERWTLDVRGKLNRTSNAHISQAGATRFYRRA
jgi:hypothetical protein